MEEVIREFVFRRDLMRCQKCGIPATEIAHRIANTESNKKAIIKKYSVSEHVAGQMLNHPLNLAASCRECNDSFNIGFKRVTADVLVKKIFERIKFVKGEKS